MFRVPRERQGGASWPQVRLVPSEPPRVSARPEGAPGGARGSHGELSFPARPRTALERGAPSRAAPRRRRPLQTQAGRPLRPDPGTASVRPSVRPWPRHVQPHGSADPHVPRGVRRGRGSGVETLALSGRPRPPSWFPRCPRLRGHPSLPGHPCPRRGVAAAVPPSPCPPTQKCRPHTRAAASGLATSPTSARRRGPLAAPAPTLGRGSGRVSGRGAGGPHAR